MQVAYFSDVVRGLHCYLNEFKCCIKKIKSMTRSSTKTYHRKTYSEQSGLLIPKDCFSILNYAEKSKASDDAF